MKYVFSSTTLVSIVIVVVMLLITGCGNNAPVAKRDKGSADVINFPDQFRNVATKCDGHGHRIYVTNYDSSNSSASGVAVTADPLCR